MPFAGLHVLSLESRRAKEMETLIVRAGGIPFVAPSVVERSLESGDEGVRFLEQLEAGAFNMVVCMTGAGLALLRDQVAAAAEVGRLSAALAKVTLVARGPKPLPVLRELGLRATVVVPELNTWKETVDVVAARPERRIAIQEYGRPNPEMYQALEQLGAQVTPVVVYRWDTPADLEPLRTAARGLAQREFDVVLFTSSIQFDHLMKIAMSLGVRAEVESCLGEWTAVASVGPVMTTALIAAGIPPDIVPDHPKMAALVKAASERAPQVIRKKRYCSPTYLAE
jgi:uroporphyrinogen-III synthase